MFDMTKQVTLTGTIKEFQWTNPHTWTWIDVPNDKGGVDTWGIEGMSPNFLGRRGWTKHTLNPGDKVTITIYPLKEGKMGGTFLHATLPDGKEMVMFDVRRCRNKRGYFVLARVSRQQHRSQPQDRERHPQNPVHALVDPRLHFLHLRLAVVVARTFGLPGAARMPVPSTSTLKLAFLMR